MNLQLVDRSFVISSLEWYTSADNERFLMYMRPNSQGHWDLHSASSEWHKRGPKPHEMVGCAISVSEMVYLALGYSYVTTGVARVHCSASPFSSRFMHYSGSSSVVRYGVVDASGHVTKPFDLRQLGHTVQMNPAQTGRGRSQAMIWTPTNDILDYRNYLQQNFTDTQIDLAVTFMQVPGLKPDTVSQWAGRDRELSGLGLEAFLAHTVVLTIVGQHKTNDILCVNASSRGYFKDVFGIARGLRSSLFVEAAWESQALDLISAVCSIAMSAAKHMLLQLREELPQVYVADEQYDFGMLPEPFDVLICTLQACVVVMPTSNTCDGSAFL